MKFGRAEGRRYGNGLDVDDEVRQTTEKNLIEKRQSGKDGEKNESMKTQNNVETKAQSKCGDEQRRETKSRVR